MKIKNFKNKASGNQQFTSIIKGNSVSNAYCVSNAGCSVLVGSEIGVVGQKSVFKNWNGME